MVFLGVMFPTAPSGTSTPEPSHVTCSCEAFEVPPPGAGVATVMERFPSAPSADAGTTAVSCEDETYVVVSDEPPSFTTELDTKPLPFTLTVVLLAPK